MSNVRPTSMNTTAGLSRIEEVCPQHRSRGRVCPASARPGLKSRFARAVRPLAAGAPPVLCNARENPSRLWSSPFVLQSIQNRAFVHAQCCMQEKAVTFVFHEESRSCAHRGSCTLAETAAVSTRAAAQRSWCRQPRPNPSVEGVAKRLRLLSTPHLER